MKKFCRLLIVLLVCCAFVGCASKNESKVLTLSGELKKEVETAWREIKGRDLVLDDDFGHRYYGTYQGAVVIFEPAWIQGMVFDVITELEIAGETFVWGCDFQIYVYKDGEICTLKNAYQYGKVTQENIKTIREYHDWIKANEIPREGK